MRANLSIYRLLSLMLYDKNTGRFTRTVTRGGQMAGSIAGGTDKDGYRVVRVDGYLFYEHHLAWLAYHGVMPKEIDHKNGIKSDNKINNLREASRALNMGNTIRNAKGHTQGVRFDKRHNRYQARYTLNKKTIHLGMFGTAEEASQAYRRAKFEADPHCRVAQGASVDVVIMRAEK